MQYAIYERVPQCTCGGLFEPYRDEFRVYIEASTVDKALHKARHILKVARYDGEYGADIRRIKAENLWAKEA